MPGRSSTSPSGFPGVTAILTQHGLDARRDLLPVAPALHYAMGGIRTDLDGRTTRAGLWAVGEVACTGVHGANRLASNSLLEGLVFADRVARAALRPIPRPAPPRAGARASTPSRRSPRRETAVARGAHRRRRQICRLREVRCRRIMTADVGQCSPHRSEPVRRAKRGRWAGWPSDTPPDAWRTANQLLIARLITQAALRRRESRGGHRRLDYPRRVARASGGSASDLALPVIEPLTPHPGRGSQRCRKRSAPWPGPGTR